jgi:DNA-binding CsgD family transcriptional regulator
MGFSISNVFIFFHALTYLLAGLLLKDIKQWKMLMFLSLGISIGTVSALPFFPFSIWPWAMAVLGVSAALYTIGWSCPYAACVSLGDRLRLMASVIIGANIVFIGFNVLSTRISSSLLLVLSGIPLWLALLPLLYFPAHGDQKIPVSAPADKRTVFPVPFLLIISLFVAGLYLCAGFMYNIMKPYIGAASPLLIDYRYLPYVAVLLTMWRFGERLQRYFLIYMGVSLLGLAFVSFALVYQSTAGMFLTTALIEAAFACLDLFIWTTLGDLAFIYGTPVKFFGLVLAAKLSSILTGGLIGVRLLEVGEHFRLLTALFAAAAIFLTYTVVPWLNELIQKDRFLSSEKKYGEGTQEPEVATGEDRLGQSPFCRAVKLLLPDQKLTHRETEIVALLLKGLANGEIAAQLHISENTLKTHLRRIYPKFGVARKKELLSLVFGDNKRLPHM